MKKEDFISLLHSPDRLNEKTLLQLKEVITDYPFFVLARLLYLKNLQVLKHYKLEEAIRENAIYFPDLEEVYRYLYIEEASSFTGEDSYMEIIRGNLESDKWKSKEDSDLIDFTQIGSNINTGYILDDKLKTSSEKIPENKQQKLIDDFIKNSPSIIPKKMDREPVNAAKHEVEQAADDELFTETLAKIYVKQGLYDQAILVFRKLSLKIPEKSIYFASQIDEIEKLKS